MFTLAFVVFLNLTPSGNWVVYILFLTLILSAAAVSRLGVVFVVKRAFITIPFVLAALPLIFTGPSPTLTISISHGLHPAVSLPGVEHFFSIAIKSWVSVQAAILLTGTTRFSELLGGFRQLGIPGLFIAIVGLMWRYLQVIVDEVARMTTARSSRSASPAGTSRTGGTLAWRARVTGSMVGSIFLRSLERSDRVYAAMVSRGYTGDLPASEKNILSRKNQVLLILGICLPGLLWAMSLFTGG